MEIFFEFDWSKYGEGVMLEEYQGKYSLVAAVKGKGKGTVFKKWCYPQKDKKPNEKAIPWKITLGDKREAATMLQKILSELAG